MAWTTPGTATVGQVYTAAYYNTHTRDNLAYLHGDAGAVALASGASFSISGALNMSGVTRVDWSAGGTELTDYDPSTNTAVVFTPPGAGRSLSGIVAGSTSRIMLLLSNGDAGTVTLLNEGTNSAAANRFRCPGAASYVITQNSGCLLFYDSGAANPRWYVLGGVA